MQKGTGNESFALQSSRHEVLVILVGRAAYS